MSEKPGPAPGDSTVFRFDPLKIPDRWLEYTCVGLPIDNTKIVAVKTPLKSAFHVSEDNPKGLTPNQEFTPTQLIEKIGDKSRKLIFVIDLTNTGRYYNPSELKSKKVDHHKIRCPGQDIPPKYVYDEFSSTLSRALQSAEDTDVVAVHCTHGINRTGYLVCRYLMEKMDYTCQQAIESFNKGRGHDMERKEYLEHLKNGCPELPSDTAPPPSLPRHTHNTDRSDKSYSSSRKRSPPKDYSRGGSPSRSKHGRHHEQGRHEEWGSRGGHDNRSQGRSRDDPHKYRKHNQQHYDNRSTWQPHYHFPSHHQLPHNQSYHYGYDSRRTSGQYNNEWGYSIHGYQYSDYGNLYPGYKGYSTSHGSSYDGRRREQYRSHNNPDDSRWKRGHKGKGH